MVTIKLASYLNIKPNSGRTLKSFTGTFTTKLKHLWEHKSQIIKLDD